MMPAPTGWPLLSHLQVCRLPNFPARDANARLLIPFCPSAGVSRASREIYDRTPSYAGITLVASGHCCLYAHATAYGEAPPAPGVSLSPLRFCTTYQTPTCRQEKSTLADAVLPMAPLMLPIMTRLFSSSRKNTSQKACRRQSSANRSSRQQYAGRR